MEPITKRQRLTYTVVSFFFSLILISFLHGFRIITDPLILAGLIAAIVVLIYFNPSWGRKLAKLWVGWSVIGSRGASNPQGVKLAKDIAENKVKIDDNLEPQAVRVIVVVVIIIIISFIVLAVLLT